MSGCLQFLFAAHRDSAGEDRDVVIHTRRWSASTATANAEHSSWTVFFLSGAKIRKSEKKHSDKVCAVGQTLLERCSDCPNRRKSCVRPVLKCKQTARKAAPDSSSALIHFRWAQLSSGCKYCLFKSIWDLGLSETSADERHRESLFRTC